MALPLWGVLCSWAISSAAATTLRGRGETSSSSVDGLSIINGTEVEDASSKYSFFALPTAAGDSNQWLGCGASIIAKNWGMTAAHCFGGGNAKCSEHRKLALWLGDISLSSGNTISPQSNGRHFRVEAERICHPDFDGHCSHGHDMVLLRLNQSVPSWVQPVPLNLDGAGTDAVGEVTVNIGFGLRESASDIEMISAVPPSKMREANLTIFDDSHDACARVYAGGYGCSDTASEGAATNKAQQLCAGAIDQPQRDTCSGDSGSPMLDQNGVQIGVVSYGGGPGQKMSGPGRICADPQYMGVYTRVSAFADFIKDTVGEDNLA